MTDNKVTCPYCKKEIEKICSRCRLTKSIDQFYKNHFSKDGHRSCCKECSSFYTMKWRNENIDKYLMYKANWNKLNVDKTREWSRQWKKNNPEKAREQVRKWRSNNHDKRNAIEKKWRIKNPEKAKLRSLINHLRQRKNPTNKMYESISTLIRTALKENKQGLRWEALVGYSVLDLKNHLKNKFQDGMTWENYGKWHIDHIIPRSAFNFQTPHDIDFKRCWALKNLQPLWAKDNMKKHKKINKPFQPALLINECVDLP